MLAKLRSSTPPALTTHRGRKTPALDLTADEGREAFRLDGPRGTELVVPAQAAREPWHRAALCRPERELRACAVADNSDSRPVQSVLL